MNYLAIDIGGTFIKYALMSDHTEILEKSKIPTPLRQGSAIENLLDVLISIIQQYKHAIEGVALSIPGIIDSDTGHAYTGGAVTCIAGQNLVKLLEAKFELPITAENDGKCAALAEFWKGSLKGYTHGATVVLGTAVGGGLIIDGKLHKGNNFLAGELSYMLFDASNDKFFWQIGGVESLLTLASKNMDIPYIELDGVKVFELANQKDKSALATIDEYTKCLAKQLYSIQCLLDLDIFAIGGGISQQPLLMEYLQKNIDEFCEKHPFRSFSPIIPKPKITTCKYFNDSNLIGAFYHHLNKIKKLNDLHTKGNWEVLK